MACAPMLFFSISMLATSLWYMRATCWNLLLQLAQLPQSSAKRWQARPFLKFIVCSLGLCWLSNLGAAAAHTTIDFDLVYNRTLSSDCIVNDFGIEFPISDLQDGDEFMWPSFASPYVDNLAFPWVETLGLSFGVGLIPYVLLALVGQLSRVFGHWTRPYWVTRARCEKRRRYKLARGRRGYGLAFYVHARWVSYDYVASSPKSQIGLNHLFRGGAGGAAVTDRKRRQNKEQLLLEGLQKLICDFADDPDEAQDTGHVSKKERKTPMTSPQNEVPHDDSGLLHALERIIIRSKKKPGTLLQRLTGLVRSASEGKFVGKKPNRPANAQNTRVNANSSPVKPGRPNGDSTSRDSAPNPAQKSLMQTPPKALGSPRKDVKSPPAKRQKQSHGISSKSDDEPTWAQVVSRSGKVQLDKKPSPIADTKVSLLRDAFPINTIQSASDVKQRLEAGQAPQGTVCLCPNRAILDDCLRLATLHKVEVSFALLITPNEGSMPSNAKAVTLPTWAAGRPSVHEFWAFSLGSEFPKLPQQKIRTTKVAVPETTLVTLRATVIRDFVNRDTWETFKRNPAELLQKTFPSPILHSTYGWQEKKIHCKKPVREEHILQGFVRAKKEYVEKFLQHLSKDGLFFEHLATSHAPKQPVWWIAPFENESLPDYLTRAATEAVKEKATLAHRRGGGSSLGLRLTKHRPVTSTWSLHGAPNIWSATDIQSCLQEAGCTDIAILRAPGRQRHWLIRACVPDDDAVGVMAIDAGNTRMTLCKIQSNIKRQTEVVETIRPFRRYREHTKVNEANAAPSEAKQTPSSGEAGSVSNAQVASRDRSRSPSKKKDVAIDTCPYADKYDAMDCGGGGDCAYLCVAMALGLEKGEDVPKIKSLLQTRARTIRHDIYKHLTKHEAEYETWYVPGIQGNREVEAGDVPTNWKEFLESTLREGRWVDGISLLAMSKRYGITITVVPQTGDPKDRPMKFGEPRSGKAPVFLLLKGGHYRLAQLRPGKQWPQAWLQAEPATVIAANLGGGGKHAEVFTTPMKSKPRLECLKSTGRGSSKSWRCEATPQTAQASSSSVCKSIDKRSDWRTKETPKFSSSKRSTPLQPRSAKSSSWKEPCTPKFSPKGFIAQPPIGFTAPDAQGFRSWTCPTCGDILKKATYNSLADARRTHCKGRHPDVPWREFLHRPFIKIIDATHDLPFGERDWICPVCDAALPKQATRPPGRYVFPLIAASITQKLRLPNGRL